MNKTIFSWLVALFLGAACTPSYNFRGEELEEADAHLVNKVVETDGGYKSTFCYPWGDFQERRENAERAAESKLLEYVAKKSFFVPGNVERIFYLPGGRATYQGKVTEGRFTAKWMTPEGDMYNKAVCVVLEVPKRGICFEQFGHCL